jgi:manganese oxidase
MDTNRRSFLKGAMGLLVGSLGLKAFAEPSSPPPQPGSPEMPGMDMHEEHRKPPSGDLREKAAAGGFLPVQTPDVPKLPYELEDGVKVFHLVAEPMKREFLPGWVFEVWGYSGSMPGPTIEVMQGDRVRIVFENRLPEPSTVHWHGLEVPIAMDGVPAISQPLTQPGEMYTYEFTLHQHGTFFYHTHMAMQEMIGLIGLFIIHPQKPYQPEVHRDFGLVLQEWAILPNNTVPNTLSMEFNWLTINGKAAPATTPLIVRLGDRVRIRMVNLGMDHHPMHLHGHQFTVTATEAGRIPESAQYPQNTVLVGVAQARVIEFEAKYPGDWMFHCHLPHHMMNHMVSMVGPMAQMGRGMPSGMRMEEGMGIVEGGHALSEEHGPSLGRGMGMETREKQTSNLGGPREAMPRHRHPHDMSGMGGMGATEEGAKTVPGFPQDMWMTMDEEVARPETYGLPSGWSGAVTGMMTLVRVLPPEDYEKIMALIEEDQPQAPPPGSRPLHHHHQK